MITAMIVDDEWLIRMSLRRMIDWDALGLELAGEAADGEEALARIRLLKPDLVLLDINLPVMNGIEVCRALAREGIPSRVLILSGYDTFEYAQQCLRLGVLDYVVKPIEKEPLREALEAACRRVEEDRRIRERLAEAPGRPDGVAPEDFEEWLSRLEQSGSADELRAYMGKIAASMAERLQAQQGGSPLARRAIAYIRENCADPELSLSRIAQALCVAPDHLGRAFKRSQGMTITAFITRYRMDMAVQLIARGETRRISDVALAVGYTDALYFSKVFKKVHGVSPSRLMGA